MVAYATWLGRRQALVADLLSHATVSLLWRRRRRSDLGTSCRRSDRTAQLALFFVSSRRRHTRCRRDWSSDVCSSDLSASLYDEARATVARFLNARGSGEIVFTRGATEAINLVASSWGGVNLGRRDEILITVSDHYSSLVPWQLAARRTGATLRIWDVSDDGHLRLDRLDAPISKRTKMVTFPHGSNVLGEI